jgi:hypothetical protein
MAASITFLGVRDVVLTGKNVILKLDGKAVGQAEPQMADCCRCGKKTPLLLPYDKTEQMCDDCVNEVQKEIKEGTL